MHHPVFSKFTQHAIDVISPSLQFNFLGVAARRLFVAGMVQNVEGKVPYPPFSEEYFEWIDILEAVIAAEQQFVMVELGAGYGRWLVIAAAAVRQYHGDMPMKLIGVEAEPTHFQWMQDHFRDNGLDPQQHELIEAAVDEKEGEVYFWTGDANEWYGQAIAHGMQPSEQIQPVKAITLNHILAELEQVDLIDLDVQGAEFVVLSSAIGELNKKVKRVHIGTHGHDIEHSLRVLFRQHGWYKVNDYCLSSQEITPWGEIAFGDGVQTWINPRLVHVQATPSELEKMQNLLHTMERQNARLYRETQSLQAAAAHLQREPDTEPALPELPHAEPQDSSSLQDPADVLLQTQQALQQAHMERQSVYDELQQTKQQLRQVQDKLRQAHSRITAMESSKFWKLRRHWFRIKRVFGYGQGE